MAEIKIEVRAIDLERLGISLCFINTDSAARKDVALQNAKRLADAFASPPVAVQEEWDAVVLREALVKCLALIYSQVPGGERHQAALFARKALAGTKGDQP